MRAVLLAVALAAMPAAFGPAPARAEQPGAIERAGSAVERGARRAASHLEKRARQAGAALERAGNWTERKVRRIGERLSGDR